METKESAIWKYFYNKSVGLGKVLYGQVMQSWRRYGTALTKILAVIQSLSSTTGRWQATWPGLKFLLRFQSNKNFCNLQFFPPIFFNQYFKHEKIHLVKCLGIFFIYAKNEEGPIFVLGPLPLVLWRCYQMILEKILKINKHLVLWHFWRKIRW